MTTTKKKVTALVLAAVGSFAASSTVAASDAHAITGSSFTISPE